MGAICKNDKLWCRIAQAGPDRKMRMQKKNQFSFWMKYSVYFFLYSIDNSSSSLDWNWSLSEQFLLSVTRQKSPALEAPKTVVFIWDAGHSMNFSLAKQRVSQKRNSENLAWEWPGGQNNYLACEACCYISGLNEETPLRPDPVYPPEVLPCVRICRVSLWS